MGQVARRMILRRVRMLWPSAHGQRVLGYGFATPYLKPFQSETERVTAVMPAQQGVVAWPEGKRLAALCRRRRPSSLSPMRCSSRILVVHGVEGADALRPLMRQLWRVLAPEGRILIVAPNRASLWAQIEQLAVRTRTAIPPWRARPHPCAAQCSSPCAGTAPCIIRR